MEDKESYIHMDGQGVFKFAVRKVPEIVEEVLEKAGMEIDDIDYFILHQANRRIIEAVAKRTAHRHFQIPHESGGVCKYIRCYRAYPSG